MLRKWEREIEEKDGGACVTYSGNLSIAKLGSGVLLPLLAVFLVLDGHLGPRALLIINSAVQFELVFVAPEEVGELVNFFVDALQLAKELSVSVKHFQ